MADQRKKQRPEAGASRPLLSRRRRRAHPRVSAHSREPPNQYSLLAAAVRTRLAESAFAGPIGESLFQRRRVGVELRLIRRRERGTKIIALRLHQRAHLIALAGVLLHQRPHRSGIAALTRRANLL